jgi:predicted amidohydrolase
VTEFPTVRIAAIQATPEILDAGATVEKAVQLLRDASREGAQLAVFPETFVPLYPSGAWAAGAASFQGWDEFWEQLWANSVEIPGPHLERLARACAELEMHCAIGVNEREQERPGSLYNTLLLIGPRA